MQVLNRQEVKEGSGGVELFPGIPGLGGGQVTIFSNVTLGLARILGVPAPRLR
ncbi:hypothetical protein [Herbaspirillum autotrophicum]|uniref:hypothetical protein n=1 Tax=Herbaspirillum autotrophicum TaxID=180195 RepID=UPI000B26D977|nr:hypothetical protein [Herbaspirillum autotrophicum]